MIKLDHLAISVADHAKAREWYVGNLGLRVEFEVPERRTTALQDDAGLTLFVAEERERPTASCVLYFQVDDVEAKYRELSARGVPFVHEPRREFWGYGAELQDPDGYRVRLWYEVSMREKEAGG